MLDVGSFPGAGSRSHIADVLAHVDKELSRFRLHRASMCSESLNLTICFFLPTKQFSHRFKIMPHTSDRCNVTFQTVDTIRWRIYRYIMLKGISLWGEFGGKCRASFEIRRRADEARLPTPKCLNFATHGVFWNVRRNTLSISPCNVSAVCVSA